MNDSKKAILKEAMQEAHRVGYDRITRSAVARRAQVSDGLVSQYFGTMEDLRNEVVSEAVIGGDLVIIGQALTRRHISVTGIDPAIKQAALTALL